MHRRFGISQWPARSNRRKYCRPARGIQRLRQILARSAGVDTMLYRQHSFFAVAIKRLGEALICALMIAVGAEAFYDFLGLMLAYTLIRIFKQYM